MNKLVWNEHEEGSLVCESKKTQIKKAEIISLMLSELVSSFFLLNVANKQQLQSNIIIFK